jgi:hypothetical protein
VDAGPQEYPRPATRGHDVPQPTPDMTALAAEFQPIEGEHGKK